MKWGTKFNKKAEPYKNLDYESLYYHSVKRNPNSKIICEWRTKNITLINYIEKLQNKNKIKILELGSGRGFLVKYLKERGFDITGSDFNKYNLKLAKEMNNVNLKYIDALNIKMNKNSFNIFDMVISVELIEHLPDVVKHFREVKKILKPSGIYCFTTPNIYIEKLHNFITRKKVDNYHISLQSFRNLKKILKKEGFKVHFLKMNEFTASQKDKLRKLSRIIPIRFLPKIFQPSIICCAKLGSNGEL